MATESLGKEQRSEDTISLVLCGLDESFENQLRNYLEDHLQVIKIVEKFDSIQELKEYASKEIVEIAFIHLDKFDDIQAEQASLSETSIAKMMIMTDKIEPFRKLSEFIEPYAELIFQYTPIRIITERMLTFETKKNLRLYTNVHPDSHNKGIQKNVLLYSAKGGVGKTTIAINIACQLAKKNKKVLLVDFATFGNVTVSLNLPRTVRGMGEALGIIEQPTREDDALEQAIRSAIYSMQFQGKKIDILGAATPMKMTGLNLDKTDELLMTIQKLDYDVVLLDTSSDLSEKNISLMSAASDIIFVSTTDITASTSLLSTMELVETLNRPLQNRHLVINHYNDSLGFPISELESILSMDVSVIIPDKYEQIQGYTNRGILLAEKPSLKLNRYYRQAAHMIEPLFSEKERGIRRSFIKKKKTEKRPKKKSKI